MLVGASEDVSEELGLELDPEPTAGVCKDLRLECSRERTRPLFEGHWA
jgi:hypothetical protein